MPEKTENRFLNILSVFVIALSVFLVPFINSQVSKSSRKISLVQDNFSNSNGEVMGLGAEEQRNYSAPSIMISGGEGYASGGLISIASTDEPAVYLSSIDYSGSVEISVYKANEDALLDYLTHDKDNKQLKKNPDISQFQLVRTLTGNVSSGYGSESKNLLPLEETGIWLLEIKSPKNKIYSFVLRSNFGVLSKEGDNEYVFWGQNLKTKRSITEGTIKLYNLLDGKKEIGNTNFDSEGVAKLTLDPEADIALAQIGDDRAIVPINLRYLDSYNYRAYKSKKINTKYFVFTDRPLYQPGDLIYFKAVLRDDDDARYSVPSGTARIKVIKNYDDKNPLFEKEYKISSYGSIDGEYLLPKDAGTGWFNIKVATSNGVNEDFWGEDYASFEVDFFRKPEYSIDIATSQKELIQKDRLNFEISGNYFSGQPLSGEKVKYTIIQSDFYNYEYLSDSSLFDSNLYGNFWSEDRTESEGVFDANGRVIVDTEAQSIKKDGKNKVFTIEAVFDNGSGNPSLARKNVLVYAGEFDIFRKDYGYGGQIHKKINVPLILVPHRKTNISSIPLNIKVHRENWVKVENPNQKYPDYKKETEDLPSVKITTNKNGEAVFYYTPTKEGSYKFTVEAKDEKDNLVTKDFFVWVTTQDYSYSGQNNWENQLVVKAEKTKYQPNDKAVLTIASEVPDRDVFLSLERGRMDRFQIVRLQGKSAKVEIPLIETDLPNIFAKASSFSSFTLDSGSAGISISTEGKKVVVNLTPDRKQYGPGETVKLNIETKDTAGNPLAAETAVWAIDKALFELVDQSPAKIFDRFWKERWDGTTQSHSLEGIVVPFGAEGGGCFSADTLVLMSNGESKKISEIKTGEFVLTRKNEKDNSLVKAKVLSVHKTEVSGYLIINGNLKVTENHYVFANNSWKQAGSLIVGDKLTDKNDKEITVNSIEWQNGKFLVYNLAIEKYHTFIANGIWVHNQKGEARRIFKDTAYWNPSVKTNSSGKAQVVFKLPDNLTTWVISGVSATTDTKVGQNTQEVMVSKDVVIRPILPNIMRVGDKLVVSALAQNYTQNDQKFNVNLKFDSGEVEKTDYSSVLIKSGESKRFSWNVLPKNENKKAKVTFSAASNEKQNSQDVVVLEVPVWSFGFFERKGEAGEGNKKYSIKLSPKAGLDKTEIKLSLSSTLLGSLSSAMEYLLGYPYGCVEQTVSRLVPALLVKENPGLFSVDTNEKKVDDIISESIIRLAKLQQNEGGWNWWSEGKSSAFKTAYVVEYLLKAKENGFSVDQGVIEKAKYYLKIDPLNQNDRVAKFYALSLLEPNTNQDTTKIDIKTLSPDTLSLAVLANINLGNKYSQTNGLNRLLSLAKTQGDGIYWDEGNKENFGSKEASTALAIRAMIAADADKETIIKAVRFLTRNRKDQYWANTFGTSQVIQALIDFSKTENESSPNYLYTVLLDGKEITVGGVSSAKEKVKEIAISAKEIKSSGSVLEIKKTGEGSLYSTLLINEYLTDKDARGVNNGIKVTREYSNEKSGRSDITVGDIVRVKISLEGLGADEYYGIIKDELPAGLIPINERFKNEGYNREYDYDSPYFEITQNGGVLSLYKAESGRKTYYYRARAIVQGSFLVPPAEASLMYAPEIWGRSDAEEIKISGAAKELPIEILNKQNKIPLVSLVLLLIIVVVYVAIKFAMRLRKNNSSLPPEGK